MQTLVSPHRRLQFSPAFTRWRCYPQTLQHRIGVLPCIRTVSSWTIRKAEEPETDDVERWRALALEKQAAAQRAASAGTAAALHDVPAVVEQPRRAAALAISRDALSSPAAVLAIAQTAPADVISGILPRLSAGLEHMNGRAFANAVGTATLALCAVHDQHVVAGDTLDGEDSATMATAESFLAAALDERHLRSKTFDDADQATLLHSHVALRSYGEDAGLASAGAHAVQRHARLARLRLPRDIAAACLRSHNGSVAALQGIYDVLALQMRRLGLPYTYRTVLSNTGYLVWLLLPTQPAASLALAAAEAGGLAGMGVTPRRWGSHGRAGAVRATLEIAGEWNALIPQAGPGAASEYRPSLAHRLYLRNLAAVEGIGHAHISAAEREALLAGAGIDGGGLRDPSGAPIQAGAEEAAAWAAAAGGWRDPLSGRRVRQSRGDCGTLAELLQHISLSLRMQPLS